MLGRSVSVRLIMLSVAWIVATLVVGGWVLSQHFRTHVENSFDFGLERHVEEVLSYAEVVEGKVSLRQRPTDPSYLRPLSGWYWEVVVDGVVIDRSRSLWDQLLVLKPVPTRGEAMSFFLDGPREEKLRVVAEAFSLPGFDKDITIYFTGPAYVIDRATEEFTETLIGSLLLLGLGLMAAVVVQVILGLRPLNLVRQKLAAIHNGEVERMSGAFPREVEPLVNDLNKLLDHNAQVIDRARTHAGNLAHALKTPLAVLGNEADGMEGTCAAVLREQVQTMNGLVTRHLARARAAGGLGVPGLKTDVGEIASGLKRTLQRIHQRKNDGQGVSISLVNVRGQNAVGDHQDIEEMLGNLMDNACKWATRRVRVTAEKDGRDVMLHIDDDGPGIPEALRDDVLQRGKRLDEATPGSGLGLSIVHELAELYHGSLSLGASDLGGLRVSLRLPAA